MSEIVQPWPTGSGVRHEPGPPHQRAKRLLHIAAQQPGAGGGNEQGGGVPGHRPVRASQILPDCGGGSGVQRKRTRLVEFALADGDQVLLGVEVAPIEGDGFADPHPGNDQQTDQGSIRGRPMGGAQRRGGGQQVRNVLVGVGVRRGSASVRPQQVGGRYLSYRVNRVQVGRKAAYHGKSACPPSARIPGRKCCPGESGSGTQARFPALFEIGQKLSEELLGASQPVTHRPAHRQIIGQGLTQGRHAAPPGHGRAMVRRVS